MKKILMLSLAITMVFASGASAKIIGDFNSDGKITLHDAIAFILHINGQKQIDEVGQELAGEDSESEDGVKLVRPELDISMPNAQAGLELLPEIAEIIDQVKDKVKATYLESGERDSFEFAGDNSGTVSVKMRMPGRLS